MTTSTNTSARTPASRVDWQPTAAVLVLAGAIVVAVWAGRADPELAIFWLFGMAFGFVLQRSRFCFTSAFRDLFLLRDGRVMKGVIVGMSVAAIGFSVVMSDQLPNARIGAVMTEAHASPLAISLAVGGVAFGLGMVLAGGCVSGSMYRMAEGYLGSWVAFAGIITGLVAAVFTWNWWWQVDISRAPRIWLPNSIGYGGALAVTALVLVGAYVFVLWWESRSGLVVPMEASSSPDTESFKDKLRSTYRSIFVRGWPAIAGGAALGVLNVFLFSYEHPWRITGELSAWGSAVATRIGLAPPALLGVDSLAGCTVSGAEGGFFNHMTLSNLGLLLGAFVAALLAHEFKLRAPRKKVRYVQSLGGGLLMGYGAGLAIGCTVGAFFSAIPSLGANGWLFAGALTFGAYLGVKALKLLP